MIGFVGLGNMGGPMSSRLVAAGYEVRGYDVSPQAFATFDGVPATRLAEAVTPADVVILMLPNSDVVEAVLDEATLRPEAVVVDMSSSEPMRTRALAARLKNTLIDAPVSGGVKGARNGKLTIMAGGAAGDIERVRPVLEQLGTVTRAGDVGSGHAVKALNNLLSATHLLVTSEAILAGEKFGLDPSVMLDIFNSSSGRSGSTENKWPNFVLPGTFDSGFGLRLMLKDMRIATGLADQVGVPDPLGQAAVDLWARAAEALDPGADHTEIVNWLRKDESR
ncbi:NAD(P)-dependent oxidoreductase [Actinoplanes sp. NPDC049265]|uniref:NAD(P)-dependent oxidoreductase n=1 Tax=Actinoplanes sp. NPDC049265 TaxID=3363902 RepID=UPI0037125049